MTKGIIAGFVALSSVITIAIAADAPPAIAREGKLSGTLEFTGSFSILYLGTDRVGLTWDSHGRFTSDVGDILHGAQVRCVGGLQALNNVFDNESSSCVYTRSDGDQAYVITRGAGRMGGDAKGAATFVGGTGKLAGIEGTFEFTRGPATVADATMRSKSRVVGTYKLGAVASR